MSIRSIWGILKTLGTLTRTIGVNVRGVRIRPRARSGAAAYAAVTGVGGVGAGTGPDGAAVGVNCMSSPLVRFLFTTNATTPARTAPIASLRPVRFGSGFGRRRRPALVNELAASWTFE